MSAEENLHFNLFYINEFTGFMWFLIWLESAHPNTTKNQIALAFSTHIHIPLYHVFSCCSLLSAAWIPLRRVLSKLAINLIMSAKQPDEYIAGDVAS